MIANGYLRLDPQEWVRAVEKRRAALSSSRSISNSPKVRVSGYPRTRRSARPARGRAAGGRGAVRRGEPADAAPRFRGQSVGGREWK
jgi:hypothetical protein